MTDVVPTGLAVLAVALMLTAVVMMTEGELLLAGLSFLSASLLIYFRETKFVDA